MNVGEGEITSTSVRPKAFEFIDGFKFYISLQISHKNIFSSMSERLSLINL